VGGDVPVDSEALLVTDFMNLKIKPAQSFGGAHKDRVCLRVFIGVNARTCMSIYACTVFLKKRINRSWGGFPFLKCSSVNYARILSFLLKLKAFSSNMICLSFWRPTFFLTEF
jgi:hypothetical protein